jgi:dihydrofolate reductase
LVVRSPERALEAARGDALRRNADAIAVIGGSDIYAQMLPLAQCLVITLVHGAPEGDAIFPFIDPKLWRVAERREQPAGPQDDSAMSFMTYLRAT